jgi:hypothetical protein
MTVSFNQWQVWYTNPKEAVLMDSAALRALCAERVTIDGHPTIIVLGCNRTIHWKPVGAGMYRCWLEG